MRLSFYPSQELRQEKGSRRFEACYLERGWIENAVLLAICLFVQVHSRLHPHNEQRGRPVDAVERRQGSNFAGGNLDGTRR